MIEDVTITMRANAKTATRDVNAAFDSMSTKARATGADLRGAFGSTASDGLRNYAAQVPVLGSGLSSLSGVALGVGAAIGGVSLALNAGLRELEAYDASIRGLNAVLRATGNSTGLSSEALVAFAEEVEGSFAIAQESVIDAQKVLSSFSGVQRDVFKDAITQAANLSAVYGGDLSGNSEKLGRVLQNLAEGSVDGLTKGFKFLTPATLDAIEALAKTGKTAQAQELLLKSLEEKIGGTAAANGQGLTGAVFALKDAWGDMLRTLADGRAGAGAEAFLRGIANEIDTLTDSNRIGRLERFWQVVRGGGTAVQAGAALAADPATLPSVRQERLNALTKGIAAAEAQLDAVTARRDARAAQLKGQSAATVRASLQDYNREVAAADAELKRLLAARRQNSAVTSGKTGEPFQPVVTVPRPAVADGKDNKKSDAASRSNEKAAERAAAQLLKLDQERVDERERLNKQLENELLLAERGAQYALQGLDVAERQTVALEYQQKFKRKLTDLELERLTSANELTGARQAQIAVIEAELKAQRALTDEEKARLFTAVQITEARKAEIAATNDALDAARDAQVENEGRIEESFRDLSDTWYDLFTGRTGNFWDNFKDDGLRALSSVAAAFSLNPSGGLSGALSAGIGAFVGGNGGSGLAQLLGGFSGLLGGAGAQGLSVGGFGGGQFQLGGGGLAGFAGQYNITGNASRGTSTIFGGQSPFGRPPLGSDLPSDGGITGTLGGGVTGGLAGGFGVGSVGRFGVAALGNVAGNLIGGTAGKAVSGAATGFAIGGPIGGLIGGAVGLISGLISGSPRAGNTIRSNASGDLANTYGFAKAGAKATDGLAQSSIDTINRAAGLLGGTVTPNFYLGQIGTKKDKFVFQEQEGGSFGEQRTSQKFATAEEAIAASLASILRRGGITGVDAKYSGVISQLNRTGSNAEDAVSLIARDKEISSALLGSTDSRVAQLQALDEQFEKDKALYEKFAFSSANAQQLIERRRKEIITGGSTPEEKLQAYNDPRGAALAQLEKSFKAETALYEKYGYDKTKLTELYLKERELTEKQYGRDFTSIEQLVDQLTNGDLAGGTDRARFAQLQQRFGVLATDPKSSVSDVLASAQEFAALNIDLNASTEERFRLQKNITETLQTFLANAKASEVASSKSSPALEEKLVAVAETTAQSGELVADQITISNQLLDQIRQSLSGQSLYLSGSGFSARGGEFYNVSLA